MVFETEILEAYARLKFAPRDTQPQMIDRVLQEFIVNEKRDVVLCAPTGAGKSIIAAVVAEALPGLIRAYLPNLLPIPTLASQILMGTNALVHQYWDTFNNHPDILLLKGANNYDCEAFEATAEACAFHAMKDHPELADLMHKCSRCEFRKSRNVMNLTKHVITNYSYHFVERLYSQHFEPRVLTVYDEAHTLNDLFVDHCAIHISEKKMVAYSDEVAETLKMGNASHFHLFRKVAEHIKNGKLNEKTYMSYLTELLQTYNELSGMYDGEAEYALRSKSLPLYKKMTSLSRKYKGLGCKIDDFINYAFDHVIDNNVDTLELMIKPIFVSDMFDSLRNSVFNLFMSATVDENYLVRTLSLDKEKTAFIMLDPVFDPENKKVIFFNPLHLSAATLKEPETSKKLMNNVKIIASKHAHENGIILAPSFQLVEQMAEGIRKHVKSLKVFEHKRGEKLVDILEKFKRTTVPSVLISPSIYEGIDLKDDLARWNIMIKAPFPSLGDKRIKRIMQAYPDIFETIVIHKLVQGAGRAVRSTTDHAITYILDTNAKRLFMSVRNIWKNEFKILFQNV